jgi:deoxyribonuclease V
MIAAVDVYYKEEIAKSVLVTFEWSDAAARQVFCHRSSGFGEYIPGQFYLRELPSVLSVLKYISIAEIEAVIIDGYVYVNDDFSYGLGGHLWESLDKKIPVIGVAKKGYYKNKKTVAEICRGISKNPLYISSAGIDVNIAAGLIKNMSGEHRIPNILKQLDSLTKE